ncbi:MAG: hypothetical protein HY905_06345 [Deltaproteobacteria bacterium]|nr:hypothetical protein [Deltaproteobacteria bacterium]
MRKGLGTWAFALILPLLGCGSSSSGLPDVGDVPGEGEAGDVDAGDDGGGDADADTDVGDDDGGGDADADADATAGHTVISLTSGGGRASSASYQLTLSIGTPQPRGAATSGSYGAAVGPGAAVNQ